MGNRQVRRVSADQNGIEERWFDERTGLTHYSRNSGEHLPAHVRNGMIVDWGEWVDAETGLSAPSDKT